MEPASRHAKKESIILKYWDFCNGTKNNNSNKKTMIEKPFYPQRKAYKEIVTGHFQGSVS